MKTKKIVHVIAWTGTILYNLVGLAHVVIRILSGNINYPGFLSTMLAATISTLLIIYTR